MTDWEHMARLEHAASGRWQEMAETLWEELQEWHSERCPTELPYPTGTTPECNCHRILAAKWDELTHASDWADDGDDT